jgi:hypothetical protein
VNKDVSNTPLYDEGKNIIERRGSKIVGLREAMKVV